MIRKANGSLKVEKTYKYTIIGHPFSVAENNVMINHPYEFVRLYLNNLQEIQVMKYIESDVQCVNYRPLENCSLFLGFEFIPFHNIPLATDFKFNCLGQVFLDGLYWFNANTEFINDFILAEGIYKISDNKKDITDNSKILFYLNGEFVHALSVKNGILASKNGTNRLKTYNSFEEFLSENIYKFDEIKVLNS